MDTSGEQNQDLKNDTPGWQIVDPGVLLFGLRVSPLSIGVFWGRRGYLWSRN